MIRSKNEDRLAEIPVHVLPETKFRDTRGKDIHLIFRIRNRIQKPY